MTARFDEPTIPAQLRRPLAALWISLGLHVALIALVQVAPPAGGAPDEPVIEVRLVPHVAAARARSPLPHEREPSVLPAPQPPALKPEVRLAPSPVPSAVPVAPAPPVAAAPAAPSAPAVAPAPVAAAPAAAPSATLTSSVDLTYYRARDLDVQPRALREIRPDYPDAADRQRLSGTLRLQLKLEADGRVSDVDVVSANPPGVFDDSAVKAFRDARFSPAQKNGRPVRALVLIEVKYDWEGR
ncbi:energy transducer TonB [Thiobacillus sedimenti]|uniref:Protein TonB n=1 Tax=Thiobacillus sedimenti TaxID=3110231 RepID=A0ABZ1CKE4_9PROT|nr:TonB family protein [Thiobacillus sp. SCUT-2]WRS38757.1 TonB family protein [Thiobacillus sp. SCUT-2]